MVTFINELLENLTVVHLGRSGFVFVDEFAFSVNLGVILIAVMAFVVLLGPTRVAIFLATFRTVLIKFFGAFAVFDLLVLFAIVALTGSIDKARVNDAAFFGEQTFASEGGGEGFEKLAPALATLFFDEFLEVSYRVGVRDFIAKS